MWILLIIAIIIFIISLVKLRTVSLQIDTKTRNNLAAGSVLLMTAVFVYCSYFMFKYEKRAYIDALKGKNPYHIEVRTEYRNGLFYSSDTLYVK